MIIQPRNNRPSPGAPRDDPEEPHGSLLGVLRKLSRLSGTLGEIDDWLESRGGMPPSLDGGHAPARAPITLENLDEHVAREGGAKG